MMRHRRAPLLSALLSPLLLISASACLSPGACAQAAGSDYTATLPSVEKIKSQLQGTDPTDTAARQVAVLEYLPLYIRRIKETRDYRGPFSPGEQKLMTEYTQAQYQITQDFKNTHSPDEFRRFQGLEGKYSVNNAEGWIKQLSGQQANDTYKGAQQSLSQTYNQQQARMQAQMSSGDARHDSIMNNLLGGSGGQTQLKPDQKRCLELGGTMNQCANAIQGLALGMGSLLTAMMGVGENDTPPPPPLTGVILVGYYHSRTDLPELALNPNGAVLLKSCGTLVEGAHGYTLHKSGGTVQLAVNNEPNPIVLTLRPDGSLSGPGTVPVKGSVITGYHNEYSCVRGNCTTSSTPIYAPSMQRCTISQLAPQAAPPPPPKPKPGSLEDLAGANPVATVYGFRVTGPYTSSTGMKLDFSNAFVTLDCGQAHVNAPYTVDNTPSGFVVHVQNGGGAFLLAVAPDTTLHGTGPTTVAGKLVSSVSGQQVSFTPHSETCNLGTFAPASNQNTMIASRGPMPSLPVSSADPERVTAAEPERTPASALRPASAPAPDSASLEASLAGAGISASPAGSRVQLRVMLTSDFIGANPLAGQAVFVSRKPMQQILRELGVAVPSQATPGQAMKVLQGQCHSAQGCSSVIQGMSKYYVATTKLDSSGKATLSATGVTGPYYFFAIAPESGRSVVWDVPANLAAGDNTVTFTQANSERVN